MRICNLDGTVIKDKEMLHKILAEELEFPEWYGANLDALYDCLTDLKEETLISLRHVDVLEEQLENYVRLLEKALTAASEENPLIRWEEDGR